MPSIPWQADPGAGDRWRSAIDSYVPSVSIYDQGVLSGAAVSTLHARVHLALHPRFTGYLESLPGGTDPVSGKDRELKVKLEIVLEACSGAIHKLGVMSPSGVPDFDLSALEAVQRSAPFGAAPEETVSPDGRVYLHWELYRNPLFACSTYFARSFVRTSGSPGSPLP